MIAGDPIRVVLVDDHALVREGIGLMLERHADIDVVEDVGSLKEALELDCEPDVIVGDLTLGDVRGPEVVSRLGKRFDGVPILVLTMADDPVEVQLSFAAGARGYLLKGSSSDELAEAIRKLAAGLEYLQPALGAALARVAGRPRASDRTPRELSGREREVLRLLALGHTNSEIASILYIAPRTVDAHRSSIQRKLGVRTRAELARQARDMGLVQEPGA